MSAFTSATLGQINHPVNILQEFLATFNRREKCKAAILSWLDGKHFYGIEWVRTTYENLADVLGYCRETIGRHMKILIEMELVINEPSLQFPKDTAFKYKLNQEKILELLGLKRCEKTDVDVRNSSQIHANNLATYINPLQGNLKKTTTPAAGEEEIFDQEPDWDAIAQQSEEWEEAQIETITKPFESKTELPTDLSLQVVTTSQPKTELPAVTDFVVVKNQDLTLLIESTCEDQPSPCQLEADTTSIGGKGGIDNEDSPVSPSREEINQVYTELRNLQVPGGIKLNETIRAAIRSNWQNVQGAIAFIRSEIKNGVQPKKSWTAYFMWALVTGVKPDGHRIEPLKEYRQPSSDDLAMLKSALNEGNIRSFYQQPDGLWVVDTGINCLCWWIFLGYDCE